MKKIKYVIKTREQIVKQRIIVYTVVVIILSLLSFLCFKSFKSVQAVEEITKEKTTEPEVKRNERVAMQENKNKIDVKAIIKENTEVTYKKTLDVDEVDLDYTTEYHENPELPTGTIQVIQEGEHGSQSMVIIKTYAGNEFIEEERIQGEVKVQSKNKIVQIGTGEGVNNYTPKQGDSIYATPEIVKVREAASRKSPELCSISKDEKAVIMEVINNNWLKVQYSTYIGYVDSKCFTNINPKGGTQNFTEGVEYSKEELLASLSFEMDLMRPSGFTLDQFKKVLYFNSQDTQGVIASSAEYFYYAEKQYGINGIYLASMAIHEGGWGTSQIANDKKNLFGYGAYDSNPYGGAYSFDSYAAGIDLLARVLVKNYLNPSGTEIYDGQLATGMYYNGPTLTGVNTRYASDKNWANAVFKWMTYLYERL